MEIELPLQCSDFRSIRADLIDIVHLRETGAFPGAFNDRMRFIIPPFWTGSAFP